ncbi:hypothetical protein CDAR_620311 [Caerostris darwini]|uniref:Uncharacterized protein n=1 Tax=Caerostris darwini TaxID=1538125 RepID=A0AAV4VKI2_9ARAC|nr:hypothetical protein CDAR_620311 [Caerostris darwini]
MTVTFEAAPQHSFCCLPPNTETPSIPSTNIITLPSIPNISTFMRMTDASDSRRMEIVYKFPSRLLACKHRKLLFRSVSGGVHLIREFPTGHLITECTGAKDCLVQVRISFEALPGEGGNADNFEPGMEGGGHPW